MALPEREEKSKNEVIDVFLDTTARIIAAKNNGFDRSAIVALSKECGRPYGADSAMIAFRHVLPNNDATMMIMRAGCGSKMQETKDLLFRTACIAAKYPNGPTSFEEYLRRVFISAGEKSSIRKKIDFMLSQSDRSQALKYIYRFLQMANSKGVRINYKKLTTDLYWWNFKTREAWANTIILSKNNNKEN